MPVFNMPSPSTSADDWASSVNARGSFFASTSTPMATPSPLIDAIDAQPEIETTSHFLEPGEGFGKANTGVVKIGQTSLHNPGGKSSWIGL